MAVRRQTWILVVGAIVAILFLLHRTLLLYRPAPTKPAGGGIACGEPCGEERWSVKTLVDEDTLRIDFSPQTATVAWLTQQTVPGPLSQISRLAPLELETFAVRARLLGFKEETDRDFHIVLADLLDPSITMIAEIPSVECSGACSSTHAAEFEAARQELEARYGAATDRFRRVPGEPVVTVTGVAFFDFLHGQRGVAPNGIEIHPVLRIAFD